jgi:hypothetical protein
MAQFALVPTSGGKKKTVNLGTYVTEQDAARAYDAALMTIEGIELTDRNFPNDPEPTTAAIEATRAMLAAKSSEAEGTGTGTGTGKGKGTGTGKGKGKGKGTQEKAAEKPKKRKR